MSRVALIVCAAFMAGSALAWALGGQVGAAVLALIAASFFLLSARRL